MDQKQINARLRGSMELKLLWGRFLLTAVVVFLLSVIRGIINISYESFWMETGIICGVTLVPYVIFCAVRTARIFHRAGDYFFCRTKLCNPHGGVLRDSIYFSVLLEDPVDKKKFFADTHAIFVTRGFPRLDEYLNSSVTVAYNRRTGMVVVIG